MADCLPLVLNLLDGSLKFAAGAFGVECVQAVDECAFGGEIGVFFVAASAASLFLSSATAASNAAIVSF